jgi:hypothetical protein
MNKTHWLLDAFCWSFNNDIFADFTETQLLNQLPHFTTAYSNVVPEKTVQFLLYFNTGYRNTVHEQTVQLSFYRVLAQITATHFQKELFSFCLLYIIM